MKIRQANLSDLDAITTIEWENFGPEEALSRDILEAHIQKLTTSFLVAERDGQILGYLEGPVRPERHLVDQSFTSEVEDYSHLTKEMIDNSSKWQQDSDFMTIQRLSSHPDFKEQGLGTLLLAACKEIAVAQNQKGLQLVCSDDLISYYEMNAFINEGISERGDSHAILHEFVWENPYLRRENED